MAALGSDPINAVHLNLPSINAPVLPGRLDDGRARSTNVTQPARALRRRARRAGRHDDHRRRRGGSTSRRASRSSSTITIESTDADGVSSSARSTSIAAQRRVADAAPAGGASCRSQGDVDADADVRARPDPAWQATTRRARSRRRTTRFDDADGRPDARRSTNQLADHRASTAPRSTGNRSAELLDATLAGADARRPVGRSGRELGRVPPARRPSASPPIADR